ncbi:MAG: hypothetical protein M1819_006548 [Sarea resinae]|nr:MAG: hypothetical protein M1819_006548 [Sarea resinae]
MPSATSSGADAGPDGSAKSREHNQGNQERKYTIEQKTAVLRVKRCSPTAFYDILGLEEVKTTVSDGEIKKAYRKLSLLTHPDKNGYDGADEAFKMVSRAFQILSDPEKREKFDRFGGDPDNRFSGSSASAGASPFSNFSRGGAPGASYARQGPMFEEEISPEEMFNRFFGGGGGGMGGGFGPFGGGLFDTGPQFVFNLGGGPGIRVHQFGGGRPRRRPRETAHTNESGERPASLSSALSNLLPLLILFVLPLLSSLFSSSSGSTPAGPHLRFDAASPPYVSQRTTPRLHINYFLDPSEIEDYSNRKLARLDQQVEVDYVNGLRAQCSSEVDARQRLMQDAQGWFYRDEDMMDRAREMELAGCRRLDELGIGSGNGGRAGVGYNNV